MIIQGDEISIMINVDYTITKIKQDVLFENELKNANISYRFINKKYFIENIDNKKIDNFINIISWEILRIFEGNKKIFEKNYSNNFYYLVKQNPFITIYIKNKIIEYLLNNNYVLDIKKFIKFNLKDIYDKYDKLFEQITDDNKKIIEEVLYRVLLKDSKFKNVKTLRIDFIKDDGINDFSCNIFTDNGLRLSSLNLDSTIQLYGLSTIKENKKGLLKHNLNAATAAIIALKVNTIEFTGDYSEETVNGIIRDTLYYGIENMTYKLN